MRDRRVELSVTALTADAWVRVGRVEEVPTRPYCRLAGLSVVPQAFLLRLQDSARLIRWEPDADELPPTGRVFAAVVRQLYDGRRWRANLAVNTSQMGCSPMIAHVRSLVGDDEDRQRDGLFEHMAVHGLAHAFELVGRNPDDPDDPYVMDYWWCPKPALGPLLAENWSHRSNGYVARWPDSGRLQACFRPRRPVQILERLLSTCKFIFQGDGAGEGEAMILLSRYLTREELRNAVQHPSVGRALENLNKKALLVEWTARTEEIGGITYTVYEKRRPGGGGIRRVHAAEEGHLLPRHR